MLIRSILLACVIAGPLFADGFEQAIDNVGTRTVRLYGLKAGLSAGYGSGTIVSDDGMVVTVMSLLLDSERLRAVTHDGNVYGAKLLTADDDLQLALLQLNPLPRYNARGERAPDPPSGPGAFQYFKPGDSKRLFPGEWVIAAGNPFKVAEGLEQVSVTRGVFSARTDLDAKRKARDFPYQGEVLVIDAITSTPGTPGGPLVDLEGNWVGIVGRLVISNRTHTNFNYAIPVEVVQQFIDRYRNPDSAATDLIAENNVEPYHGIKLFEMGYQKDLVYVERVKRGSPAHQARIRKDDLIVSINGRKIADIDAFHRVMRTKSPGDMIDVSVIRKNKLVNTTITLEEPR